MYVAARPLCEHAALDHWPGVSVDAVLDEVWAPRARDARNRESGRTWLRKTLSRLQEEVARAAGGLNADLVLEGEDGIRLNPN
jgi:hypothetical protein